MPTITETVIRDQFPYWQAALHQPMPHLGAGTIVVTGCGTSYYLAQSLACAYNAHGQRAIAVPAAEWARRPQSYLADCSDILVLGLSRSGTTTETVQAMQISRAKGWPTFALSCVEGAEILTEADQGLYIPTDPREGIVMSVSASLMLLAGLRLVGIKMPNDLIAAARHAMAEMAMGAAALIKGRHHFVYLGAGAQYGLATEGSLKLQEMSITYSQAFHPMEYRHGPISLIDDASVVVILYSPDTVDEEAKLAAEVRAKGARVIGFGGPGDLQLHAHGLATLPALQILGEMVALQKGINSEAPRHLTKVVVLG